MPFWGGLLLAGLFAVSGYHQDSGMAYLGPAIGYVLLFAVGCQLAMFGAQGVSAQVLPVPFGKSIRGRGAATTGMLLLAAVSAGVATAMLALQSVDAVATGVGIAAGALLLAAGVAYFWCMPTAVADFGSRE